MSKEVTDDLFSQIGDNIFNGHFFDKLELWEGIQKNHTLKIFFPDTRHFQSYTDFFEMLDEHKDIYIKKINSHKAKTIIKVTKNAETTSFIYQDGQQKNLHNVHDIINWIEEENLYQSYIVQQGISPVLFEERHHDFRIILQKNQSCNWQCSGVIAKFGKARGIQSSVVGGGKALHGLDALIQIYKLSPDLAEKKLHEMINTCILVAKHFELYGNYGDVGFDVILDKELNIWILEMNKLHDHKLPLTSLNDHLMFHRVVANPFYYAKGLAGFK